MGCALCCLLPFSTHSKPWLTGSSSLSLPPSLSLSPSLPPPSSSPLATAALAEWNRVSTTLASLLSRTLVADAPALLQAALDRAVLSASDRSDGVRSIVCARTFKDAAAHSDDTLLPRFFAPGDEKHLTTLMTRLKGTLSEDDLVVRTIAFAAGAGVNGKEMDHRNYLRALQSGVEDRVRTSMDVASRTVPPPDALLTEVVLHGRITAAAVSGEAQHHLHQHVVGAVLDSTAGGCGAVSVACSSGSDVRVLAAHIAHGIKMRDPGSVLCVRHAGASPGSTSMHAVLTSLYQQVGRAFGRNVEAAPPFAHQLPAALSALMTGVESTVAIVLANVVAAVVSSEDRALLASLVQQLQPCARLVLVSDSQADVLAGLAGDVDVAVVAASAVPRGSVDSFVEQALKANNRTLTKTQRQVRTCVRACVCVCVCVRARVCLCV